MKRLPPRRRAPSRVNGDGAASAAPDIADIELGVETIDADPKAAIDDNTTAMASVIEALIDLEIAEDDIQTRSFNMWVEQIYGPKMVQPANSATTWSTRSRCGCGTST